MASKGELQLSSANFLIMGAKQKSLCINVQGNVIVYFKIEGDVNCAQFNPVFSQLVKVERRVTMASLDINKNKDVVIWSRDTSTPINAVPSLILYINGKPHAKLNGTKTVQAIQSTISKMLESGNFEQEQSHTQFMQRGANMYGGHGNVPQQIQNKPKYVPEIGSAPSMKGIIKGAGNNSGFVGNEDDNTLLIPESVVPYNTPWGSELIEN